MLDVGASAGEYTEEIRRLGYKGRIVSYEPLSSVYSVLWKKAQADELWDTYRCALGEKEEQTFINIAGNSDSSSLLNMLPLHVQSAPESKYVGQELINVVTLDSVFDAICNADDNVYLKIDVQGYESRVLRGAEKALRRIDTIQIEMSLKPLYADSPLFDEMHELMSKQKYQLVSIEPGHESRESGELLQFDAIYHRCEHSPAFNESAE